MQEEIEQKTVLLIENCAKLTAEAFETAIRRYLSDSKQAETEKPSKQRKQPKIYRGKQTLKQLSAQNAGLSNIEITDQNIKAFSRVAKKYHVDFALKKDRAAEQPRYLVFFKSRDADAITAAFQEFAAKQIKRKPSIRQQLSTAKKQAEKSDRMLDREKSLERELIR